jgi:hypothetical protein
LFFGVGLPCKGFLGSSYRPSVDGIMCIGGKRESPLEL